MKFYPPTSEPLHIALTNGHTAMVDGKGSTIDPMFFKDAILLGCTMQEDDDIEVIKKSPGRPKKDKETDTIDEETKDLIL